MDTRTAARKERSVRLNDYEWNLAEALARLDGERSSAGLGIRTALRTAEAVLRARGRGEELDRLMGVIENERTG